MMKDLLKVLQRIVNSRKSMLALIDILGNVGLVWGFGVPADQLMEGAGLVWNLLGTLLITLQGIIDAAQGSPSDGTQ